jgi:hypothetical protein
MIEKIRFIIPSTITGGDNVIHRFLSLEAQTENFLGLSEYNIGGLEYQK